MVGLNWCLSNWPGGAPPPHGPRQLAHFGPEHWPAPPRLLTRPAPACSLWPRALAGPATPPHGPRQPARPRQPAHREEGYFWGGKLSPPRARNLPWGNGPARTAYPARTACPAQPACPAHSSSAGNPISIKLPPQKWVAPFRGRLLSMASR